ncbi:MAG: hypothetical protein LBE99_04095 [Puniceicoccales bacterium]|nr:hypothetical protein [Puniceicoccales bacterium]
MKTILNQTSLELARGVAKLTHRTVPANDRLCGDLQNSQCFVNPFFGGH